MSSKVMFKKIKNPSAVFRYLLASFIVGLSAWSYFQPETVANSKNHISRYNGQKIDFTADIAQLPDKRINHTKLILQVTTPAPGKVLANVALYPQYYYGDQV